MSLLVINANAQHNFKLESMAHGIRQHSLELELTSAGPQQFDKARYGVNKNLEMGEILKDSDGKFRAENLAPATFYHARPFYAENGDTTWGEYSIHTTASLSTGEIRVFFNHPVLTSFSSGVNATSYNGTQSRNALINYIQGAQSTIDVAIYNCDVVNINLVRELNYAVTRGVRVRYIHEDGTSNTCLTSSSTPPNFPTLGVNPLGLMHNKFLAIDAGSVNGSWVVGGSLNWTDVNINDEFNNVIAIQDQALCQAYVLEFEEMWGSNGAQPNSTNSRSGSTKTNNTPHIFNINGKTVKSYFSPSDGTTAAIDAALNSADEDIMFALLSFTMDILGNELIDRKNAGVSVRGAISNIGDQGSEFTHLTDNQVSVKCAPSGRVYHHKFAVVDESDITSDPLVVTGSHNWSNSAETRNDENTLIVHDAVVANQFKQAFEYIWQEVRFLPCGFNSSEEVNPFELSYYPNPASSHLTIEYSSNNSSGLEVTIRDLLGREISQSSIYLGATNMDISSLPAGVYLISFSDGEKSWTGKLVKI